MARNDDEFRLLQVKGEYGTERLCEATSLEEIRDFIDLKEGER